jgi:FAD/FMN-containing dehydrogenase
VVGGYGLFGVILDVDLEVTPNVVYQSERRALDYRRFPHVVGSELLPDPRVGLIYAHLSTAPKSFLQEMLLYTYREIEAAGAAVPPLDEVRQVKLRRLVFNAGRLGPWGARLKWAAEKYVEPRLESCPVSRNQAMSEAEACLVSRNSPMHDSVAYLQNNLQDETDILQEYFVPRDRFEAFVDGVRDRVQSSGLTLLNASVRIVRQEGTLLTYAPQDRFGLVLYLAQSTDREGTARMAALTAALVDLTADLGGRFFLPYQLHYTPDQLLRAYPEIREFFAAKREHDPHGLLSNTFYEKYAPLVFRPS